MVLADGALELPAVETRSRYSQAPKGRPGFVPYWPT